MLFRSQITTGAPQAGFRCDPSAAARSAGKSVAPGTDISGIGTLKSIDEAARQGYREDFSIRDAAESLWRKETQTFNLKDLDDPEKSKEFLENWRLQARWDLGIQGGPTKDEVISAYIDTLRQNGLDGAVDWNGLAHELKSFQATSPEELEDGLNYILFVRAGGKLWRVDLQHFCSVQNWWSQSSSKQAAIKWDVLCEISCLLDGEAPGYGSGAVTELKDLQVEKEDNWSWTCFYESEDGKRKKLRISKGYPDFCPVSGMERSQGPAPARWIFVPLSFLVTAAIIAGFWALDMSIYIGPTWNRPQTSDSTPEANTQPEVKSIPARVPEQITEYEMSEVWFRVDSGFKYSRRTFLDGDTGTLYRAYVQYGVDASDAWDTLSQHISEYRVSPLYDRFDAVYLDQEPLAPLNETSRYNIVSVYLTDGQVFHTAAVLSDDGTLFTMEAEQDASDRSEDVLANLMFTLESVRFDGPVVTEENYQSRIHVSEVRDCSYMAAAYLKTDLFGHDAFVDVYVPYSDSPIYSSDGRAIRTEAHGLRVYATIVSGENAKAVVDARQQELAATGQVYEDGVDDEMYREDLDAACKLTVYEENGQKRQAVLYADSKWEGYYLLREITGLPELVDEEYPAALKELEGIIGLTMPVLEELGGS